MLAAAVAAIAVAATAAERKTASQTARSRLRAGYPPSSLYPPTHTIPTFAVHTHMQQLVHIVRLGEYAEQDGAQQCDPGGVKVVQRVQQEAKDYPRGDID